MIANEYVVTKQLYLEWYKENRRKGVQLKITIMWAAIMVILIAATVIYALSPYGGSFTPWLSLEAAMMIYCVYHLFFRRKFAASRMYDKLASQLGVNWTRTVIFEDDCIHTVEGAFEVRYPYSEIVSVRNVGSEIIIEMEKQLSIRIYKDKFVSGDYSRFKRFIESKAVNKCLLS